ncbi:FAD-dependent oxidoreductase [Aminobacter carboxidus]|uniref:FAD-dependent oxidoreductase n=1 Tax=Aminobacter carboxidus TaxID=376165 RepID=A0ABR9GP21_9HYPH|nr:FAD-dependent oxidoreductase [Aminobacter carboxidus]MBE1205419.1 FAD-dependent oxidoreductase [Aminobacter carboxidus]
MSEPSVEMLEGRTFDVLVVGAGANGSATAEALAIAGYAVLLVERSDFGSGTSSRSSRMLHCGFRSLEGAAGKSLWQHLTQLPDRLALLKSAREQLAARADFVGAMPHRVRPVTIVMPLFRGGVGGMQMDTAAALLALLGTGGIPLDYKRLKADNLDDLPFAEWLLPRHDLAGVVTFRDYVFDWPERVCADQALAAERLGAEVRNYTSVNALRQMPDGQWSATLRDEMNGAEATVAARMVLNLAGPWIDSVTGLVSAETPQRIAASKGVQIGVALPERYKDHGLVAATDKGAFVCIPSQGLHLIGATNSKFTGDPSKAAATDAEINDLLARANALLPGIGLDRSAVCYAIAGVRPGSRGSSGRIVHDHAADGLPGLVSVTGGTVATSRQTAKSLLRLVVQQLKVSRPKAGSAPPNVLEAGRGAADATAFAAEHARTIADVALRRTGEAWSTDFNEQTIQDIAASLGASNGWDQARIAKAISDFRAELAELYRRDLGSVSSPQTDISRSTACPS